MLCGRSSLLYLLVERRALLLTPTNMAFGLMTALYPSKVTVAVKHQLGAPAVGWLYALSGGTAAATTLLMMPLTQLVGGRSCCIGFGAFCFGVAALWLSLCDDRCELRLSWHSWALLFVLYGCGVAAWQACIMALVGDVFKGDPRAAFAHLKLTSGLTSFAGFMLAPAISSQALAAGCFCLTLLGAACFGGLLLLLCMRRRGSEAVAILAVSSCNSASVACSQSHVTSTEPPPDHAEPHPPALEKASRHGP
uniref:Uncharacterized protein n=1 Tax=Calcidiscus leptoporus TaxID=127549 RepID=A0A7S0NVE9_9EUKA